MVERIFLAGLLTTSVSTYSVLVLHPDRRLIAVPVAVVSAIVPGFAVISGDTLAAAIFVVGLAFCAVIGKFLAQLTIPIATALREWGYAYADVKGRIKRELADTRAEVLQTKQIASSNASQIVDLRTEAERVKAEKDEIARALAETERRHQEEVATLKLELDEFKDETSEKRHKLANELQPMLTRTVVEAQEARNELDLARARIAELEAKFLKVDLNHVQAINANADNIEVLADRQKPPVKIDSPHLEPLASDAPAPRNSQPPC